MLGHYGAMIAFTKDTFQTPYPVPFPNYINSFMLSVNVWKEPTIRIYTRYIHDRVEPGNTYNYDIKLENTGNEAVDLKPELSSEGRYYYGGPYSEGALPEDWIIINAPKQVKANSKATVKVTINVPRDAKGRYEGQIDLNIDDPSLQRYDSQVHLSLEVWSQPTEPFTKKFDVQEGAKVDLTISTYQYKYDRYSASTRTTNKPSFIVTLKDPNGNPITAQLTKRIESGSVNLGMYSMPPWEIVSAGVYNEESTRYSETYTIDSATSGEWTLSILPKNTDRFDYTIVTEV